MFNNSILFEVNQGVVGSAIPGLRAVPDLVPIHPILPPTVHIHLQHSCQLASAFSQKLSQLLAQTITNYYLHSIDLLSYPDYNSAIRPLLFLLLLYLSQPVDTTSGLLLVDFKADFSCSLWPRESQFKLEKVRLYLLSWNPRAWALPNLAFLVEVDLSFPEVSLCWSIESQIHHQRHKVGLQTSFRRR